MSQVLEELQTNSRRSKNIRVAENGSLTVVNGKQEATHAAIRAIITLQKNSPREICFIPNELFEEALRMVEEGDGDLETEILGATMPSNGEVNLTKAPKDLPPYLAALYNFPLLTREQEQHLFRKMNYLKYKAAELSQTQSLSRKGKGQVLQLLSEVEEIRKHITQSNLRLVVSHVKRYLKPYNRFEDLVSDGNMYLMAAVEKFDYSRGNKFSTYATWALIKNFSRPNANEKRDLKRNRTGYDKWQEHLADHRSSITESERLQQENKMMLEKLFNDLNSREREVMARRYGLAPFNEPQTLEEVGRAFGVSKERIRQLQARAIGSLKRHAIGQNLSLPEDGFFPR